MGTKEAGGFLLALWALLMTAVFQVFAKIKRVRSTGVNPMVFNIYFQAGVIFFCAITAIILQIYALVNGDSTEDVHFTYYGLLSGLLLGIGSWLIWLSLTYMGISHTSAIASGIASTTGFLEGLTIGETPNDIGLSVFAIVLICTGILGVGFNEVVTTYVVKYFFCQQDTAKIPLITPGNDNELFRFSNPIAPTTEFQPLSANNDDTYQNQEYMTDTDDDTEIHQIAEDVSRNLQMRELGILFAFLGGICFGSLSFPAEFTDDRTQEVYYLPSFGVGVLLILMLDIVVLAFKQSDINWHFQACFVPGLVSGIIWSTGFLAILYAQTWIGYDLAIPIRESSICVAVLIGIFGFNEIIDRKAIVIAMTCVCITVVGCFLMAIGVD